MLAPGGGLAWARGRIHFIVGVNESMSCTVLSGTIGRRGNAEGRTVRIRTRRCAALGMVCGTRTTMRGGNASDSARSPEMSCGGDSAMQRAASLRETGGAGGTRSAATLASRTRRRARAGPGREGTARAHTQRGVAWAEAEEVAEAEAGIGAHHESRRGPGLAGGVRAATVEGATEGWAAAAMTPSCPLHQRGEAGAARRRDGRCQSPGRLVF
ncbi:hypothetical protein C8Q78DRAFT_204338 [Trametes maxima]|nr:hypothetical protein C8Q78DRAFT_204338 [Trametes maxima]